MRTLIILRGSPASGKSTWVKNMGLENYTLSADNIRLLVESPVLVPEKKGRAITQENDGYVWQLLFELLEKRMQRGEFVIVDATHSRSSDFSRYNNLCEKYRYRRYYVDFSDVSMEECLKRNKLREDYKQVPDNVIYKIYSRLKTQSKTSGWVEISKNKEEFWKDIGVKLFDMNKYDTIHIFGDIHGCYEPLKEYFNEYPYKENDFYIFCGDYIDRGLQNKETLEFLMEMSEYQNVLLLEGNHERWLNYYSLDEIDNIKSRQFLNRTMYEIEELDKKKIRKFYRKLGQMAYFEFDNMKYFVSHGGLNYIPEELQLISTYQMINGVGDYSAQIDEIFTNNERGNNVIQVHGHRNTLEIANEEYSYNLEGKVEFGGDLRILQLNKDHKPVMLAVKNTYHNEPKLVNEFRERRELKPDLEQLRTSKYVKEIELDNNISSFNFTRDAFFHKKWDNTTCTARGLFVDTQKDKVVARGYSKFFNINEREETKIEHLLQKFKGTIKCYKKENGFLGIMSYVSDELFLASKSTNKGEFAEYFKNIFDNSDINKEKLIEYLKENDVSLTFEVIDVENDPHIIKYDKSKLVLLDIIHNDYKFIREPYEKVQELAEKINCECKKLYIEFKDNREFYKWYIENSDEDNMTLTDIEGVVIENNDIMTKFKFPYYNFWKLMRRVKEQVLHKSNVKLSTLYNATANYFYAWLKKQNEDVLKKDIISLRDMFNNESGGDSDE